MVDDNLEKNALRIIDKIDAMFGSDVYEDGKSFKEQSDANKLIFLEKLLEGYNNIAENYLLDNKQFAKIFIGIYEINEILVPYLYGKLGIKIDKEDEE